MVLKFNELEMKQIDKPRGGTGSADCYMYKEICGMGRKITAFNQMVLKENSSIALHAHVSDWEAYLIFDGRGKYNDNGTEVIVEKGDLTICKAGESHSIEALDGKPLSFLALMMD